MSTTFKTGWLLNDNGEKFAPKTLLSQVSTNDGVLLERKIETDLLDVKTELNTEIAVERARIDAFTALPEGSTTGDAALEDIKIKVDGTPADTAGNAVREQINTLDNKIDEETRKLSSEIEESEKYILSNDEKYKIAWRIGGCNADTGVLVNDNKYINTEVISFDVPCCITYDATQIIARIIFFDDMGNRINSISFNQTNNGEYSYYIEANSNFIISAKMANDTIIGYEKDNDVFRNISIRKCVLRKECDGENVYLTNIPFVQGYFGANGGLNTSNSYIYSKPIEVKRGQRLEFFARTSTSIPYAFICDSVGNYVSTIGKGNGNLSSYSYTAKEDCFVSIQMTTYDYKVSDMNVKICSVEANIKNSPLFGSAIGGIGDSLMYGNKLGNSYTWFNKIGEKYHMSYYNFGQNGSPIGIAENYDYSLSKNIDNNLTSIGESVTLEYFIILGGANDKRLNVPIGTNEDTNRNTFKGGLKYIINAVLTKYPKCKLLLMTNFNRYPDKNSLGLSDIHYVDAMKEVAEMYSLDCYDNYRKSGLSFQNPLQLAWIDEGLSLGLEENHHFSDEASTWLTTRYIKELERL